MPKQYRLKLGEGEVIVMARGTHTGDPDQVGDLANERSPLWVRGGSSGWRRVLKTRSAKVASDRVLCCDTAAEAISILCDKGRW